MRAALIPSLVATLFASTAIAASSGLPVVLTHTGYLIDAADAPAEAPAASVKFELFDQSLPVTTQKLQWEATCTVAIRHGFYAVVLGGTDCPGTTALETTDLPPDEDRWLQVSINGSVMVPRLALTPSAGAVIASVALDARKLGGVAAASLIDAGSGKLLVSAFPSGAGGVAILDANAKLAAAALPTGSITNAHLADDANIALSKIAGLGALASKATIVDADVAASAGIAASKIAGLGALSRKDTVVDADIDANARIAVTKIAGLGALATKSALEAADVTGALGFTPIGTGTALSLPANGLSVGTNQLVLTGGRVGIGTNPLATLDIGGTDAIKLPVGTTAQRPTSAVAGMLRYNSTTGSIEFYNGTGWGRVGQAFAATGGTVTDVAGFRFHTFTSPGTFTVGAAVGGTVEVVVVGGGGGGGCDRAGGGGGGGVLYSPAYTVAAGQAITVSVGAGGGGATSDTQKGGTGGVSVFGTMTALGGGGGGSENSNAGLPGGSGGGGAYGGAGGAGTSGQGNNGGTGVASPRSPGGGGGAGAAGTNGNTNNPGPAGGVGLAFFGNFYGGGGGAGDNRDGAGSSGPGAGGNGGGGQGGLYQPGAGQNGTPGAANTGGGGGGGGAADVGVGGTGGSGVVIVRYPL